MPLLPIFLAVLAGVPAQAKPQRWMRMDQAVYRGAQPGLRDEGDLILKPGAPSVAEDFNDLKQAGIKSIVNFRDDHSQGELHEVLAEQKFARGMRFEFKSTPLPSLEQGFLGINPVINDAEIIDVLNYIHDPANQPVFMHCKYGKDRTGMVAALYRVYFQGWEPKKAHDEMLALGFSVLEATLEEYFWTRAMRLTDLSPFLR